MARKWKTNQGVFEIFIGRPNEVERISSTLDPDVFNPRVLSLTYAVRGNSLNQLGLMFNGISVF